MIQLDKIKSEIERYISHYEKIDRNDFNNGEMYICQELLSFIESLEKEQDVDLEKEIEQYTLSCNGALKGQQGQSWEFDWEDVTMVIDEAARHFYDLGCRQKDNATKIKGWVARDKAEEFEEIGYLHLFASKPHREYGCSWIGTCCYLCLDKTMFPDLKWEDEPIKVELTISQV